MADLNDLIKSKKVKDFVRTEKNRPWTVSPVIPSPEKAVNSTVGSQIAEKTIEETNLQRISRDNLEENEVISGDVEKSKPISREYQVINRESLQRISRDNLGKCELNLNKIVGLQRRVLFSIFDILQSNGSRVSPPIAIGPLSERINTSIANTQNAIKELIKKDLLIRKDFQRGRGGWTIYEVETSIYSMLDSEKTRESLESLQRFSSTQMGAKSRETLSSSSSNLLNKNTTTTQDVEKFEFKLDQVSDFGLTASAVSRCFELYPKLEKHLRYMQ